MADINAVSCPPGTYLAEGKKAGGGTSEWCWLVWSASKRATGPTLGWLKRMAPAEFPVAIEVEDEPAALYDADGYPIMPDFLRREVAA